MLRRMSRDLEFPGLAELVAVLFGPVVRELGMGGEGDQALPHAEERDSVLGVPPQDGL